MNQINMKDWGFREYAVIAFLIVPAMYMFYNHYFVEYPAKRKKIEAAIKNNTENLIKELKTHGIRSIYFVCDEKGIELGRYGLVWSKLEKVYVNGIVIQPDDLYRKEYFIYKHCGEYYIMTTINTDSISYQFYPVEKYIQTGNNRKYIISQSFESHKYSIEHYKNRLPKCEE